MHPSVSAFPRHVFYGGKLLDAPGLAESRAEPFHGDFPPFVFFDLDRKYLSAPSGRGGGGGGGGGCKAAKGGKGKARFSVALAAFAKVGNGSSGGGSKSAAAAETSSSSSSHSAPASENDGGGAAVRRNPDEAALVVQCFAALRGACEAAGAAPLAGRCGVLTPYNDQLKLLRRLFADAGFGGEVELSTVDGFQVQRPPLILPRRHRIPPLC